MKELKLNVKGKDVFALRCALLYYLHYSTVPVELGGIKQKGWGLSPNSEQCKIISELLEKTESFLREGEQK